MFLTNLKSSLWVMPCLLLELAVYVFLFNMAAGPWIDENSISMVTVINGCNQWKCQNSQAGGVTFNNGGGGCTCTIDLFCSCAMDDPCQRFNWEYYRECFGVSTILAVIFNILLLIVIPCALGGYDPVKKRIQFLFGFFTNLAVLLALPIIYFLVYQLDHTTFVILLGLHAVSFMGTYIIGSRFVSPSYRRAFWFTQGSYR